VESTIECREVFLRLGDDEVLILDVRGEDEWGCLDVQIPGALRIPPDELVGAAAALPDDELIVLCGCGHEVEVRRAYRQLWMRGLDVVVLQGGMRTWISLGYPTERLGARADRWLEDARGQG
jgi:rhodanese-related sulfurtransferase